MFIRRKKNRSGSVSVQIISKHWGKYKLVKTIGSSTSEQGIELLFHQARFELSNIQNLSSLFPTNIDSEIEGLLNTLSNADVQVIGPELIFGRIYDAIGFNSIKEELFRHLVIARLAFPLSKLKTVDYLYRFQGVQLNVNSIYRFLDKLQHSLKDQVQQIAFDHTYRLLQGNISIVFYDMTTIYFEASDEDDLRKTGFSKDGKHQNPQIYLGLLVTLGGYAIGYDIFEGNIFEGHTLIPFIDKISNRFNLSKPIVVADAGLLSYNNIEALEQQDYEYIIGARLKSESLMIKNQILTSSLQEGQTVCIQKVQNRLIVAYSSARAAKDEHNRKRGLQRLENQLRKGKLTKSHINNKGYNKYLKMKGEINIEIDYDKYKQDAQWDGLKGYLSNSKLKPEKIIENYNQLWQIERAFRMSKTDLRIRPIYHHIADRIEAHICISFSAYTIYKELERILYKEKAAISLKQAAELTHNMYQIIITLPDSKKRTKVLLKMTEKQNLLLKIIAKYY